MQTKLTMGSLIRSFREERHLSREQLAKRLSISKGYLGHLENDVPIVMSQRLYEIFNNRLGLFIPRSWQESHNMKARRYYRSYRKSKIES